MTIKCIASDIDGTLITSERVLAHETAEILQAALKQGLHILPTTGRSFSSARAFFGFYGLKFPMINLNGAQTTRADGTASQMLTFPYEDILPMMEWLENRHLAYAVIYQDAYYTPALERYRQWTLASLERQTQEIERAQLQPPAADSDILSLAYLKPIEELGPCEEVSKIILFPKTAQQQKAFLDQFSKYDHLQFSSSGAHNIEITQKKANKGRALERYLKAKGIKADEVLVFGDSYNDISMLERFPNSFAMANAPKEVQAVARFTAPRNDDHGVAQIIQKYL